MIVIYLISSVLIAAGLFINKSKWLNYSLVTLFLVLQWLLTLYQFMHRGLYDATFFKADSIALLLLATLSIISIPALFHSYDYIYKEKDNPHTRGIYFGAMILLIMALSAAYLSSHIAVTWIFVEITTLSASALIFHRRNAGSIEATWKYIFVCSISLVLVFVGILFLSIALGESNHVNLQYDNLVLTAPGIDTFWLRLAFVFLFSGYSAKFGLVPMYTAGIDAKDKAPTPAAALFSSVLMNVGFIGVFRFYQILVRTEIQPWASHVMMIAAFLSVFVATVYMLKVKNIKRMLAYSSIEHMGIVVFGLAAGGVGYYAAILHIILHSFAKSSLFFQIGHLYKTYQSKNIYDIGNYFKYNTAGAVFILIAFICVTAMPPSGLFISEFFIFKAMFEAHYLFVLIPVLILLTMIIWALGKNIFKMMFTPPIGIDENSIEKVSGIETFSQYVLLSLVIYLGIFPPNFFVDLLNEAVHLLTV
jgi:hydrogenase-4 component F